MNAAARLQQDQQTLLRAVLGGHADDALWALVDSSESNPSGRAGSAGSAGSAEKLLSRRGLQAYQSHGLALAQRALGAAYPVIAQLVGDENFAAVAQHFWRQQPPICGDIAQWGAGLANFLAAAPQLAAEPYLADVARVEWALHRASFAADALPDPASFACLSAQAPATPSLTLSPGVWLLASAFPVVSLIHTHLLPADDQKSALAHAAALLECGTGENALVWRQGFRAQLMRISAAEHALLVALLAGESLDAALTKAACAEECPSQSTSQPAFDFTKWLANAVKTSLVTGASFIHHDDGIYNNTGASA